MPNQRDICHFGPYPFHLLFRRKPQFRIRVPGFLLGPWCSNHHHHRLFGSYYDDGTMLSALNVLTNLILLRILYKWKHYTFIDEYALVPCHQGICCRHMFAVNSPTRNRATKERQQSPAKDVRIKALWEWMGFWLYPFLAVWSLVSSTQSFSFSHV